MSDAMNDFKPVFHSDYTGKRHDDLPLSQEDHKAMAIGITSFIAGMAFAIIINLLLGGAA